MEMLNITKHENIGMRYFLGKQDMPNLDQAQAQCVLLTNGLGGYASVTAAYSVSRCDMGLLVSAVKAPNQRITMVHRFREQLLAGEDKVYISSGYSDPIAKQLAGQVRDSFREKFYIKEKGYLKDVLSDTDADEQIRCNQIWAVSMSFTMLDPEQERSVVETVYRHLYTPCGLRSLSPEDPEYHPNYGGPQVERDMAYHQGTVWVFPLGAYYLAYLKVEGDTPEAAAYVRQQLQPLEAMLRQGCFGQLPEIYDGDNPTEGKGCFAQAWSVGEMLRVFEKIEKIEKI